MAAVSSPPQASGAASQISSLICASDVDVQELGLKNAAELATADDGLAYLKSMNLAPHITNLVDSKTEKVKLLANWCVANMTSKDEDTRIAFAEAGITAKLRTAVEKSSGQALEKVLASITNLAQNTQSRMALSTQGIFVPLLQRISDSVEPKAICELLIPVLSLLKATQVDVHEEFVKQGGVEVLMKFAAKLAGNMSGSLKSQDYELLRSILVVFFFLSVDSTKARVEIVAKGFLDVSTTFCSLILPPDIGTQSILLQLMTNLSCTEAHELPILDSGFLLSAVDYLGSVSDELRIRASMLLANLTTNPRICVAIKLFGWDAHILALLKHPNTELQRHALRFVLNISANDTCRKLLVDNGVLALLESIPFGLYSGTPIAALVPLALANLRVPISKEAEDDLKVETIEVEAPDAGNPRTLTSKNSSVNFTSLAVQDPFLQLDMELKQYFGPESSLMKAPAESAPAPIRGRTGTVTMTRDPKDEPMYIRREKIAREVFDTEEKYVASLKTLVEVFVVPLNQAIAEHKAILTADEMTTVFSVTQLIYNLHLSFLSKLRPLAEKWSWSSCIGPLFETLADRLKVYETFVNNYDRALALIDSPAIQKRKAFQAFMKDASSKATLGYAGISHYLIMPIQRPPRFLMLLGELVKYTPPNHLDLPHLKRSVQKMSAIASYLNEARRVSETSIKVDEITVRFGGPLVFEGETFDIAKPGRVFLREGSLLEERSHLPKSNRDTIMLNSSSSGTINKRDSWQMTLTESSSRDTISDNPSRSSVMVGKVKRTPRYVFLFLFNDALLVASMQKKILRSDPMHAKLTLINVIPLSRFSQVEPINAEGAKEQLKFQLKFKDEPYPFIFSADSEIARGEWLQSLKTALMSSRAREDQDSQISELDRLMDLL